jgi:hypothetical protein
MHLGETHGREAVGPDDLPDRLHPDSVLLAAARCRECLEERFDTGTNGISDGLFGGGAFGSPSLRLARDADRGGTGDRNRSPAHDLVSSALSRRFQAGVARDRRARATAPLLHDVSQLVRQQMLAGRVLQCIFGVVEDDGLAYGVCPRS